MGQHQSGPLVKSQCLGWLVSPHLDDSVMIRTCQLPYLPLEPPWDMAEVKTEGLGAWW